MSLLMLESTGQGCMDEVISGTVYEKHYFVIIKSKAEGENCDVEKLFLLRALSTGY